MYMKLRQKSFTNSDLIELEILINKFCKEFVTVFSEYSQSQCKIPKLHVLRYYIIPFIKLYGSTNGISTKTYKTLYKKNVKIPYRMTNKKNYISQMLNTVQRQYLAKKQKLTKTRRSSGFQNLLWTYKITEINMAVSQIKQDDNIHHLYKEGFDNLLNGFDEFIMENDVIYNNEFGYFKIYSTVAIESTDIIRTTESFYGNDWFSDIVVFSSEKTEKTEKTSMWYGKALLLLEFFPQDLSEPINLVLVRWYNEIDEVYGCPRLQLTDQYTCIYLDSVDMSVHIVPRNNCED
ncbi:11675_t:CDS:2, partial [Rhizophagus irregularis]